jgi:hypothetical protein
VSTLTSWKEIAHYLGKGVRTAQRWEQLLALPVRRPVGKTKGIVLAETEEIDTWLSSSTACLRPPSSSEIERLEKMVSDLLAENSLLRGELERALGNNNAALHPEAAVESLSSRYSLALETSAQIRLQYAERVERSNRAQELEFAQEKVDGKQSRVA